jgi:(1->4)-alpha-D-glucan 1-alpha-D-glucosylmutase
MTSSTPTSTYRLQLQPDFPFAAAEAVVPHLAALGVSHLHLSPVLQAVPGSTHGYDVVDHTRVRDELGGEDGLRSLAAAARAHGLGLILDIVPNHMAVPAPEHLAQPLWEVLRDGPESRYARWFDIDWQAQGGKVLLPVLGAPLEEVIDALKVEDDAGLGEPVLRYFDHAFPVRPGSERLPVRELAEAQWYRLAWWRQARTEINYRRFFTISDLIGVRVEDQAVFEATHATLIRLLREGVADGLRIDHPDGLADPAGYLRRLSEASGGRWTVVEKILTADEALPGDWACAGTTGYDALDRVDGVFTDPEGVELITAFYREFTGAVRDQGGDWAATARRAATGSSPMTWPPRWTGSPGPPSGSSRSSGRCCARRSARSWSASPSTGPTSCRVGPRRRRRWQCWRRPLSAHRSRLRTWSAIWLSDGSAAGRTRTTSRSGSRRSPRRCAPSRWRTPPSTGGIRCCR